MFSSSSFFLSFILFCCLAQVAAAADSSELVICTAADYSTVYFGDCSSGDSKATRSKMYQKLSDSECKGPEVLDLNERVSCECSFSEIEPEYSNPQECASFSSSSSSSSSENDNKISTSKIKGFTNSTSACVFKMKSEMHNPAFQGQALCPCQEDDIEHVFGKCYNASWRRIVSYFSRDCDPSSSASPNLPKLPPKAPCTLSCLPGEKEEPYILLASAAKNKNRKQHSLFCSPCQAGEFSDNDIKLLAPYSTSSTSPFLGSGHTSAEAGGDDKDLLLAVNFDCETSYSSAIPPICPSSFGFRVLPDGSAITSGVGGFPDSVARLELHFKIVSAGASIKFEAALNAPSDTTFTVTEETHSSSSASTSGSSAQPKKEILSESGRVFWRTFEYSFAPQSFSTISASEKTCTWSLIDAADVSAQTCLIPNQIFPFQGNSFFSSSNPSVPSLIQVVQPFLFFLETDQTGKQNFASVCQYEAFLQRTPKNIKGSNFKNSDFFLILGLNSEVIKECGGGVVVDVVSRLVNFTRAAGFAGIFIQSTTPLRGTYKDFFGHNNNNNNNNNNRDSSSFIIGTFSSTSPSAWKLYEKLKTSSSFDHLSSSSPKVNLQVHHVPHGGLNKKIVFEYKKGPLANTSAGSSSTAGDLKDQVLIRNIVISGTKLASPQCSRCKKGFVSVPGQSHCSPCSQDTFSAPDGSKCVKCPEGTSSPKESSSAADCVKNRPCTSEDYKLSFGACFETVQGEHKRKKSYIPTTASSANPLLPLNCDKSAATAFTPPADTEVACSVCPKFGQVPKGASDCGYCLASQISNDDPATPSQNGCLWCKSGETSEFLIDFKDFSKGLSPVPFSMSCDSCFGTGFEFATLQRQAGTRHQDISIQGHQVPVGGLAVFEFSVDFVFPGSVDFSFFVENTIGSTASYDYSFEVAFSDLNVALKNPSFAPPVISVTNLSSYLTKTQYDVSFPKNQLQDIQPGRYKIEFRFSHLSTITTSTTQSLVVGLHNLRLRGPVGIGSTNCISCPTGFSCESHKPASYCPVGTFHPPPVAGGDHKLAASCIKPFLKNQIAPLPWRSSTCPSGVFAGGPSSTYCYFETPLEPGKGNFHRWQSSGYRYDGSPRNMATWSHNGALLSYDFDVDFMQNLVLPSSKVHNGIVVDLLNPGENTNFCRPKYGPLAQRSPMACVNGSSSSSSSSSSPLAYFISSMTTSRDSSTDLVSINVELTGDRCFTVGNPSVLKKLTLKVNCAPEIPANKFVPDAESVSSNGCQITVTGRSFSGCPLCAKQNIGYMDEDLCESAGIKLRNFFFVHPVTGARSASAPCRDSLPGFKVQLPQQERLTDCPALERLGSSAWWVGGFAIFIVVCLVVFIIVFLYNKNKKLKNDFEKLQSELGGEMVMAEGAQVSSDNNHGDVFPLRNNSDDDTEPGESMVTETQQQQQQQQEKKKKKQQKEGEGEGAIHIEY